MGWMPPCGLIPRLFPVDRAGRSRAVGCGGAERGRGQPSWSENNRLCHRPSKGIRGRMGFNAPAANGRRGASRPVAGRPREPNRRATSSSLSGNTIKSHCWLGNCFDTCKWRNSTWGKWAQWAWARLGATAPAGPRSPGLRRRGGAQRLRWDPKSRQSCWAVPGRKQREARFGRSFIEG